LPAGVSRCCPTVTVEVERPDIHILNIAANDVELAILASLQPTDSIATGASKIKGGASKILKQLASSTRAFPRFGTGYFACTTGPRTSDQLNRYLEDQCQHRGYHNRRNPPFYLRTWSTTDQGDADLQANHSRTIVRWHLVFSTWNRKGTFSADAAEAVAGVWARRFDRRRVQFRKVSFLPDHVHLAIGTHPSIAPADVVLELLNSSQKLIFGSFDGLIIATGNRRVWKPSAYVGTYGDVSHRQVQAYLRNWRRETT
jgi:REP element-mobilizing transposase RayT